MRPHPPIDAVLFFFTALLAAGCQTAPVRPVESKPEHFNVSAYRTVVVERAEGEFGTVVGTELSRQLRDKSRYQPEASGVTVVDLRAVLTSDYQERVERRQAPCVLSQSGTATCWNYVRIGTLTVHGVLRMVDARSGAVSGELRTSCELGAQKSALNEMPQSLNAMPPSLDIHALAYGCAADIVRDFEEHSQPSEVH